MEKDRVEANGECRLYIAKHPYDNAKMCFGLPKNSHLKHLWSQE